MTKTITVHGATDDVGEQEVFTWDLFAVVDPNSTMHLDENGLPKPGTRVAPGMILVGKLGKSRGYDSSRDPTSTEIDGLSFEELRSRFGDMWIDRSLYADSDSAGVVESASIRCVGGEQIATVVINVGCVGPTGLDNGHGPAGLDNRNGGGENTAE